MAHERTFSMLKPGVLQRRISGEIISRIEKKGFHVTAMKIMRISEELCRRHYSEHEGKPFFPGLIAYMTSGPVIAMVLEGENAIAHLRLLCGATNVDEAAPGTIRGDYASVTRMNIIHASDSVESAEREIKLFFKPEEILEYVDDSAHWLG
ncbi:nucleoside-diphosphate kinase [Salinispira pacifica]|uniref:Nucleoside diphosphate kinase n=1 Tax=Salinispira pacifica TaxID=1307761 RepID=V5WD68_9SPIO|nr:nucleoside-diphosphate kinase [Salinispira pacifica]AHC13742.1 Nucleoside diphosphate kinase [Salinispira pacifica]